jgi:hypothetical protein
VEKTTLYLPPELKAAASRAARQRGLSEAEVIRQAVAGALRRPAPRPAPFASDEPLAPSADELLEGFGER